MRMEIKKDISQMSCIKFNNTKLGGYWDTPFLNFIQIIYSPCLNTTENGNSCLDPYLASNTLDSKLISFNIYTNVYFTDLGNYDNPLKSNLYNIYSYVNTQASKNMKLFYRSANISTDLNYIVQDPNKYSLFGVDNFIVDSLKVNPSFEHPNNDTNVALMEIYFSNNIETFNVSYIKLQEILATLGGIHSFVTLVLKNIASLFNIHYRNLEIFNELFDFNDFKNEEKLNFVLKEKLNVNKLEYLNTIFNKNPITPQKSMQNKICSDSEMNEKCDPTFFKARDEISNISIIEETSKNQIFNYEINNKGNLYIKQGNKEENKINTFYLSNNYLENKIIQKHKKVSIIKLNQEEDFQNFNKIDKSSNKEIYKKKDEENKINFKQSIFIFLKKALTLENVKEFLFNNDRNRKFFHISLWLKLKYMCCKKTLSAQELFYMKIYKICEEIFIRKMDMINYMKFIQEYTHVECLLFNDIHSLCLSFIKKPKVYENNKFTKIESEDYKKVFDIINYFQSKNEKTKEDLLIFNLLSKTFKKIIKKFK